MLIVVMSRLNILLQVRYLRVRYGRPYRLRDSMCTLFGVALPTHTLCDIPTMRSESVIGFLEFKLFTLLEFKLTTLRLACSLKRILNATVHSIFVGHALEFMRDMIPSYHMTYLGCQFDTVGVIPMLSM